jgi:ferric-dicitrate binding protein FerR (iron transport regulator)
MPDIVRDRWWLPFVVHGSIVATAVGLALLSWFIAAPIKTRLHETIPGQRLTVLATPDIAISLDAASSVAVTNTEPSGIELLRGNAFFDVRGNQPGKLNLKVGTTYIRDTGTRFSASKRTGGGSVAVANGQVEILVKTGTYLVGARERADFDGIQVTGQRVIADTEIAPWRHAERY